MDSRFDDIRPYTDAEIPAAMRRITEDPLFPHVISYLYPGEDLGDITSEFLSFRSISDFQTSVMKRFNETVISRTVSEFTYDGIENLSADRAYTFISNHRDIVMDSSFLQYILHRNGLPTSEITFGSNLMSEGFVVDIGKSNRMFTVIRKNSSRDFLAQSAHLSDYMRTVVKDGHSVWIAQRNGRTKDGDDRTDSGLMKMLAMSGDRDDLVNTFGQLHIVPVSVSYGIEPCCASKCAEIYIREHYGSYAKGANEDLMSIVSGITMPKGSFHLHVSDELAPEELAGIASSCRGLNDFVRELAAFVDRRIWKGYRLAPYNYIAYDIADGGNRFSDRYSSSERNGFVSLMEETVLSVAAELSRIYESPDCSSLRKIYLGIYANPVRNALSL